MIFGVDEAPQVAWRFMSISLTTICGNTDKKPSFLKQYLKLEP
jgi:hypothetical protein